MWGYVIGVKRIPCKVPIVGDRGTGSGESLRRRGDPDLRRSFDACSLEGSEVSRFPLRHWQRLLKAQARFHIREDPVARDAGGVEILRLSQVAQAPTVPILDTVVLDVGVEGPGVVIYFRHFHTPAKSITQIVYQSINRQTLTWSLRSRRYVAQQQSARGNGTM